MIWKSRRNRKRRKQVGTDSVKRRSRGPERLESRRLMTADPIHVGVVYLETDYLESDQDVGSDSRGDRFILSFTGGAADTELRELRIRTDKDGDGISVGDPIYDTQPGGRGKAGAHGFQVVKLISSNGGQIGADAIVDDGGQELVLRLTNFRAGDRLEFTIDVDEVLRNAADLAVFNDRLDVITSGQEFQDSLLEATFEAPHYETSNADAVFLNDYGDPARSTGLDLPADEGDGPSSRPNRSAAAIGSVTQVPRPVEISGHVWIDNDLDAIRESGEAPVAGVEISLWKFDQAFGDFRDTGLRATTGDAGQYKFSKSLDLKPGRFRLVESQPTGLFSVDAVAGTVDGSPSGMVESVNVLTDIDIPLGDQVARNYDFAEAQPASLAGFVYRDDNDDGRRDPNEPGIAGVRVELVPVDTISDQQGKTVVTDADGAYQFVGLQPGTYEIVERDQPVGLLDGKDSAGRVRNVTVGIANNAVDRIEEIQLRGGDDGIEYNFGELPLGSLGGFVFLAAPGETCSGTHESAGRQPLAGTRLDLLNAFGEVVAETETRADGSYYFGQLPPGVYEIVEHTPDHLIEGKAVVGSIAGAAVGSAINGSQISNIVLQAGLDGEGYNFCEAAPAQLSGFVYHDRNDDGKRDPGEEGIASAEITLVNSAGQVVARQTTDRIGRYEFKKIVPGLYTIVESQPAGFVDGRDSIGQIRGQAVGRVGSVGDRLEGIRLQQGDSGVEYNFGELLAASLAGRVHADLDGDCEFDPGEDGIAGVVIQLLNSDGNEVARTTTDSSGRYQFEQLIPGTYTLVQQQPQGLFDGSAKPGSVGGVADTPNRISSVKLLSGESGVDYDFCERPAAEISGAVYNDTDGDCVFESHDVGIAGVTLELYDADGKRVATTRTNAAGWYRFLSLPAGLYTIREIQPAGWFQGSQSAGVAGGVDSLADVISQIPVGWGQRLADYNFCELEPASISGQVWQESQGDQEFGTDDRPVSGVTIQLIDGSGQIVRTSRTDGAGQYRFDSLEPGIYSVREIQPAAFFHGGQLIGNAGGSVAADDLIIEIDLASGQHGLGYDFPEIAPASISGYVFQDGGPITLEAAPDPRDLRDYSDGQLTPDDTRLTGVTIELRNQSGLPAAASDALAGIYDDGAIIVTTDADGFFEFRGLRPGTYHLYQVQPEEMIDGIDTPGTAGGLAINAADELTEEERKLIEQLSRNGLTDPGTSAILDIQLSAGQASVANYFSELVIAPPNPQQIAWLEDRTVVIPEVELPPPETFPTPVRVASFATPERVFIRPLVYASQQWSVSWHLSVINGGFPSTDDASVALIRPVSTRKLRQQWTVEETDHGHWMVMTGDDLVGRRPSTMTFGRRGGIALTGDFDGDGFDEAVIFAAGQWFVDLNGNGVWDSTDLWMQLGTSNDRPVVGDWDGDGKDDIGIYGRQWKHDPQRIRRDPGLPDPENLHRRQVDSRRHLWDREVLAVDRQRLLYRGNDDALRADAIDHVFQYGERTDTPVCGDWNGDGIDQIAIYRDGKWRLDVDGDGRWTGRDETVTFGIEGDQPVVGDFNGDRLDEIGVVRGDLWIIDTDGDRKITPNDQHIRVPRTDADSQPVVGDFDGDGTDDFGYYRNSS